MSFCGRARKLSMLLAVAVVLFGVGTAIAQTHSSPSPVVTGASSGHAATPDGSARLSPQAAYDRASAPIEITRRDRNNWSYIERNAVDVAVLQAGGACKAR